MKEIEMDDRTNSKEEKSENEPLKIEMELELDIVNVGISSKNAGYFSGSLSKKITWGLYVLFVTVT